MGFFHEIWAGDGRLGSLESKLFVYVLFRTILSSVELKGAKIMLEIHSVRAPLYPVACTFITPFLKSISLFSRKFRKLCPYVCTIVDGGPGIMKSIHWIIQNYYFLFSKKKIFFTT